MDRFERTGTHHCIKQAVLEVLPRDTWATVRVNPENTHLCRRRGIRPAARTACAPGKAHLEVAPASLCIGDGNSIAATKTAGSQACPPWPPGLPLTAVFVGGGPRAQLVIRSMTKPPTEFDSFSPMVSIYGTRQGTVI